MARLSSTLQTAVGKKVIQAYELVYLGLDTRAGVADPVYLCNAPWDITYTPPGKSQREYLGIGQLMNFGSIQENANLTISEMTIVISGLRAYETDETFLQEILDNNYTDRPVEVERVFYDSDTYLDGVNIFQGKIVSVAIQDDPTSETTVSITIANNWYDYERVNGMLTNNTRHTGLYPGDTGFEFAKDVIKDIKWQPPQ